MLGYEIGMTCKKQKHFCDGQKLALRQHSTVVVHPTCNRKVVSSNLIAGFKRKILETTAFKFD